MAITRTENCISRLWRPRVGHLPLRSIIRLPIPSLHCLQQVVIDTAAPLMSTRFCLCPDSSNRKSPFSPRLLDLGWEMPWCGEITIHAYTVVLCPQWGDTVDYTVSRVPATSVGRSVAEVSQGLPIVPWSSSCSVHNLLRRSYSKFLRNNTQKGKIDLKQRIASGYIFQPTNGTQL